MASPVRTITVALDVSKALDTLNIHTLIRKLLQTNIPGTIIMFIASYIKGRNAYTACRNHTSRQRQFKTCVPQGGVLSPTLFNIYSSDLPPPSARVPVMVYQMTSHPHPQVRVQRRNTYNHTYIKLLPEQNILNQVKTTCTLFTPDPTEYMSNLVLKIHNTALPMATHPNVCVLP